MKKMMVIISAVALAISFGQSQQAGTMPAEDMTSLHELMANLPQETMTQVHSAMQKAEEARKKIEDMRAMGKSEEEIRAAMDAQRMQAHDMLQNAINDMDHMTENAKEGMKMAHEQVQKRMEEKMVELEMMNTESPMEGMNLK